jgi:transposase
VVSALEWAEIRTLARDGVSQREIARRLGINRRTVVRALGSDAPPRYVGAPSGSQLDRLVPVIRLVLEQWPDIKAPRLTELLRAEHGYEGSVDLVRRRLAGLRPRESARRSGRVIAPGRWCSLIGGRCRPDPGSVAWSGGSMR